MYRSNFQMHEMNKTLMSLLAQFGASFSAIRTPGDPKSPPFVLFIDIQFWLTDAKISSSIEGKRAPKKRNFFGENFSKSAKKRFFGLLF